MKIKSTLGITWTFVIAVMLLLSACSIPSANGTNKPMPSDTIIPTTSITETPKPNATAEPKATATEPPEPPSATPESVPSLTLVPVFPEGAPVIIGLYERKSRKLAATEYTGQWIKGKDIVVFYTLPTRKESVEKVAPKTLIEKYWDNYRKMGYRIGYRVSFTLKSGEIVTLNILSPKDAPPHDPSKYFSKFVEIYLYDNAKKDPDGDYGTWHLQERFMTKETLITSIKLTAGKRISEVTSIDLVAFVYKDNSDFDAATGEYIGPLSCEIPVNMCK